MSDFLESIRAEVMDRLRHQYSPPRPRIVGREVRADGMVVWRFEEGTKMMAGSAAAMRDHAEACPCGGREGVPCPPRTWDIEE